MIKIGDRWTIEVEPYCYSLRELKIAQKGDNAGNEYTVIKGYFSSLQEAMSRIYEEEVKESVESDDYDLKTIIAEMWAIKDAVIHAINNAEIVQSEGGKHDRANED